MKLFRFLSIALQCGAMAWSQAVVEHTAATAASSAGTAAAGGVARSISGVFGSLNRTLEKAGKNGAINNFSARSAAPSVLTSANSAKESAERAPAASKPIDRSQPTIGLDRDELVKRCGEPSMSVLHTENSHSIETYWYESIEHDVIEVTLRDGKISSVTSKLTQASGPQVIVLK